MSYEHKRPRLMGLFLQMLDEANGKTGCQPRKPLTEYWILEKTQILRKVEAEASKSWYDVLFTRFVS